MSEVYGQTEEDCKREQWLNYLEVIGRRRKRGRESGPTLLGKAVPRRGKKHEMVPQM